MVYGFVRDLIDRKRQVRHYLLVLAREERLAKLGVPNHVREGRLHTLRAGTFLVLYNLIEATTRGAIEAIHDNIVSMEVAFSDLSLELRKEVIARFKKRADPSVNHTMENFPSTFVAIALALDEETKLSGSVDARKIRELAERYGFSHDTNRLKTWNGSDLVTIKSNRNDLAHGLKSFEDVGRRYPSGELMLISKRTMRYMTEISENISTFIDRQDYKE